MNQNAFIAKVKQWFDWQKKFGAFAVVCYATDKKSMPIDIVKPDEIRELIKIKRHRFFASKQAFLDVVGVRGNAYVVLGFEYKEESKTDILIIDIDEYIRMIDKLDRKTITLKALKKNGEVAHHLV